MNDDITEENFNRTTIVFGGGCFWCTEAVFKMLKGIYSVESGYAGGEKENPIYEEISSGNTGHAEVVKIEYDPRIISFEILLTVFFATHDPTILNRQGRDVGSQYRSIILYTTKEQKTKSKKFIKKLNDSSENGKPIVTEIKPLTEFFEAEESHKNYYKNHPEQAYCQVVINPKLEKVKEKFAKLLKNL
jgi:peptide-methionine (S)-S-oxide reductase